VIGVLLLVGLTVVLSLSVGAMVTLSGPDPPPNAGLELTVEDGADRIALTHTGGDVLAVTELRVSIRIDGEALDHQPPVPFFAARGFESGPTGPFNVGGDTTWRAGETASVRLAGTNAPQLRADSTVSVTVATDTATIARLTGTTD
jgi:FlaG/FlaF family flagellin (archaellin)